MLAWFLQKLKAEQAHMQYFGGRPGLCFCLVSYLQSHPRPTAMMEDILLAHIQVQCLETPLVAETQMNCSLDVAFSATELMNVTTL